jgi:hypothetical protein
VICTVQQSLKPFLINHEIRRRKVRGAEDPPRKSAAIKKWSPSLPEKPIVICFDASAEFLRVKIEHILQTPASQDPVFPRSNRRSSSCSLRKLCFALIFGSPSRSSVRARSPLHTYRHRLREWDLGSLRMRGFRHLAAKYGPAKVIRNAAATWVSSRQQRAHGRQPRPCAQQGPQSLVRQVEGGSALRDDRRRCLTLALAHSGAASDADCDERCDQRDYKLLHWSPRKIFKFTMRI